MAPDLVCCMQEIFNTRTAFAALRTAHGGETSGAEVSSGVRLVHGIECEHDGADILQTGLIPNISDKRTSARKSGALFARRVR